MKLIYTILIFISYKANAETYYVANSGSDGAAGTGEVGAWRTLAKAVSVITSGDSILLKKGDSWNETFNPPSSDLFIGSYGTGIKPEITGFQSISLSDQGSNIWTATLTNSVIYQNTVLINGRLGQKGRYPNSSYLTTTSSSSTQYRLVKTGLTGSYVGGELVTRGYQYIVDVCKITAQVVDTITVSSPFTYLVYSYSFFFQNLPALCDVQNDFAYDSTSKLLTVYSTTTPTIKYSTIDTLVNTNGKTDLIFDGINFTGANNVGINSDTSRNVTIQNCTINNIGGYNPQPIVMSGLGGSGIRADASPHMIIKNDSILNCLNNAIFTIRNCDTILIENNYIKNAGYIEGMGCGSNGAGIGIFHNGDSGRIINNRIDSVGYVPIFWNGRKVLIKNNYITNFTFIKSDGGGIYTGNGTYGGSVGSIVRSNIIFNGLGTFQSFIGAGVYLDYSTFGVTVDSNTISNCRVGGITFNAPSSSTIHDNTIVNGIGDGWHYGAGGGNSFDFKRNIYYITDSNYYVINTVYTNENGHTISVDSNYYLRPIKEANKFFYQGAKSFATWKTVSGWDANSYETPTGITAAAGVLHINPTLSTVVVPIIGRWKDAKGILYDGLVTIAPFQSALLFYTTTQPEVKIRVGNLIFN